MATNKTVRVVTGAHPAQYRSCSIISAATDNTFPIYAQTSLDDRTFETIHDAGAPPVTGLKEVVVLGYSRAGGSVTADASGVVTRFVSTAAFGYTGLTTTASANLIICYVVCTVNDPPTSVVWDAAGANQTFTRFATQLTGSIGAWLAIYGLVSPSSSGNKTITVNNAGTHVYATAAASFKGANSNLTNAVPLANIKQGASGSAVASWNITSTSDNFTVAAGHMSFIADVCENGLSSSATWTTNSGNQVQSRTAYYVTSGTDTLKITPDVNEWCAGMAIDISP